MHKGYGTATSSHTHTTKNNVGNTHTDNTDFYSMERGQGSSPLQKEPPGGPPELRTGSGRIKTLDINTDSHRNKEDKIQWDGCPLDPDQRR